MTQLYRIIADNWETFLQERAYEGRDVPKFIRQEFEGFLRCGILACGFGRVCCPTCGVDKLVAFSCKGRGFCPRAVHGEWPKRLRVLLMNSSPWSQFGSSW
jgi:hypothetical protein